MNENNNFNKDSHAYRSFRLRKLSDQIVDYSVGMNIPSDLINWATNSYNLDNNSYFDMIGARNDLRHAKHNQEEADKLLLDAYQKCKMILVSQFHNDAKLMLFGIEGATPRKHNNLVAAADIMLKAIAEYELEIGSENLPLVFKDALQAALTDSINKSYKIGGFEENYLKMKQIYEENFAKDSVKLRALYNLIISYQGREDFGLPIIGFAIDNKKRGRKRKKKSIVENDNG
jgi:hypothetical protein